MRIDVCNHEKIVAVWLTETEQSDEEIKKSLKPLYMRHMQENFKVAVFLSGQGDLFAQTEGLLLHNRMPAVQPDLQH